MLSINILRDVSQEQKPSILHEPHGEGTELKTQSQILRFEKSPFQGENFEDLVG